MQPNSEVYDTIEFALNWTKDDSRQIHIQEGYERQQWFFANFDAAIAYVRKWREQDAGQWQPISEPLDFFDNVNGFVAQITATQIRAEIFGKVYTINFSDDEPLIRVCEQGVPTPAPVAPQEDAHDAN